MRNIIELALNRNRANHLNESSLMNHLNTSYPYDHEPDDLPLSVDEKPSWDILSENGIMMMKKTFKFIMTKHMLYFINEGLEAADEMFHFPDMRVSANKIDISLYTQDINDVTEQDTKLAKIFDDIYDEVEIAHLEEE